MNVRLKKMYVYMYFYRLLLCFVQPRSPYLNIYSSMIMDGDRELLIRYYFLFVRGILKQESVSSTSFMYTYLLGKY